MPQCGVRRSIVLFDGQLFVASTRNPFHGNTLVPYFRFRHSDNRKPGWYQDAAEGSPMAQLDGGETATPPAVLLDNLSTLGSQAPERS
jgi:hypothetical protein